MSEEEGFAQEQPPSAAQPQERPSRWEPYEPYLSAFVEGERGDADSDMVRKLMRDGSFSWMTLLVGPLYWAYRRCYAETAIYGLCWFVMALVRLIFGLRIATTVLYVAAAFLFYPIYRKRAMRVYGQAYATHGNDREAMLDAMRAAGGASWVGFMVAFLLEAVILIGIFCKAVLPMLATYQL